MIWRRQSCRCRPLRGPLGYGRLKKNAQGKDTLNEKQILPCWHWCHGPLLFLNRFLRFVLLLLLHNSDKLAIPNDHLLLRLQVLQLFLFKSLQRQGELSISGRADLPFVQNGYFAIYFWPSVSKSFPPCAVTMRRGLRHFCGRPKPFVDRWPYMGVFAIRGDIGMCHWPCRWVDGAYCKFKYWFLFQAFLWTCRVTEYFQISRVGNRLLCRW